MGCDVEDENKDTITFCCGKGTSEDDEANAALIVAAVNACFKVSPDDPLAVAEALLEIVTALRDLITLKDFPIFPPIPPAQKIIAWNQARSALAKIEAKP
jgi:hypothetical protein